MLSKIVVLYSAILCVFAAPPTDKIPLEKQQPTVIPIISQSEELESNGTFKFSYETANGITREEVSYDKVLPKSKSASSKHGHDEVSDESNEIHVQKGSYSYTAPDGSVITVRYIADENGFRPIGDHLPKPPSLAVARAAEKKGRKASLDSEVSESAPAETKSGHKDSATHVPQIAALEDDLNSEPAKDKPSPKKSESSSASPAESSTAPSTSEEPASEATTNEAPSSEATTSEETTSEVSTTTISVDSKASTTEASTSEVSTTDGSTTEVSTTESSTLDASTPETSTLEVSSTPEPTTTEITSTVADQVTTESSTTTIGETELTTTSDSSTTTAASETTLAST